MHQAQPAGHMIDQKYLVEARTRESNDPTHEKEGGSLDDYRSESSPEISKTDADPSAYIDGEEGTSSFQDTPYSRTDQNQDLNHIDDPNLIQNLNKKAQQITDHLKKMKEAANIASEEDNYSESLSLVQN